MPTIENFLPAGQEVLRVVGGTTFLSRHVRARQVNTPEKRIRLSAKPA